MDLTRICLNLIVCLSVFLAVLDVGCDALIFKLEPNARKCLSEEVHKDVLVAGEYTISEGAGQQTDLQVCHLLTFFLCFLKISLVNYG